MRELVDKSQQVKGFVPLLNSEQSIQSGTMSSNDRSPPPRMRSRSRRRSSSRSSVMSSHTSTKDSQSKHIRSLKNKYKKARHNLQQQLDEALEMSKDTAHLKEENRQLKESLKSQADELRALQHIVHASLNVANDDFTTDMDMETILKPTQNHISTHAAVADNQSIHFPVLQKPRQQNNDSPILKLRLPPQQPRKQTVPPQPINTTAAMPSSSNAQQASTSTSQPTGNTVKANLQVKRPPPIITSRLDIKATVTSLEQKLGHRNFHFRPAAKGDTSIITQNEEDFKATIELLKSSDIDGHAYTPKSERKLNIIIRNLCPSYNQDDVVRGINESQVDVRIHKIERYSTAKSKRQGYELNLWHLQLEPESDVVSLLALNTLLNQRGVRFERMRSQQIAQCRNCQDFNHSAINCFRKFRCVKCLTDHKYGECTKSADQPVGCINCGSTNHPANYRGCPIHLDLLKRLQEKKEAERKAQAERQAHYSNYRQPNLSYSKVADSRQATDRRRINIVRNQINNRDLDFDIQAECHAQFGMDFRSIRQRLTKFAPTYHSSEDKSSALLEFIMSIHPLYQ